MIDGGVVDIIPSFITMGSFYASECLTCVKVGTLIAVMLMLMLRIDVCNETFKKED